MEKTNEKNGIESIIIDGVEYLNQNQAALTAGVSIPTFRKRVKEFTIEQVKRPSGRILYRKQDIVNATPLQQKLAMTGEFSRIAATIPISLEITILPFQIFLNKK